MLVPDRTPSYSYHDQAKANAGNFSFKCHRVELKGKTQLEKDTEKRKMQQDGTIGQLGVYAVNSIAFNRYNTFVTAGASPSRLALTGGRCGTQARTVRWWCAPNGPSVRSLPKQRAQTWEHYSKARLKQFDIKQGPISTTAFSRDASMLAYAVSCVPLFVLARRSRPFTRTDTTGPRGIWATRCAVSLSTLRQLVMSPRTARATAAPAHGAQVQGAPGVCSALTSQPYNASAQEDEVKRKPVKR
jgi:hypothetical protein